MRSRNDGSHMHWRHHRNDGESHDAHEKALRENEKQHAREREDRADRGNINAPANVFSPHPIRKVSAAESANQTRYGPHGADVGADLRGIQVVDSAEERSGPRAETKLRERCKTKTDEDQHVAPLAEHEPKSLVQVLL